jgi:two-component system chemotaxis sensor kinase CheA
VSPRLASIGLKLSAATVGVVAVLALCVYSVLIRYEHRNMMASKEAAASMVTELYVATAAAPLTFGDQKGVEDVVALLSANDDVVYAAAYGVNDEGTGLGQRLGELRRGEVAAPPGGIPSSLRVHRTASAVVVDAPVLDPAGKPVGAVQAAFSLERELEALASMEHRILLVSVATSIVMTAVLLLVARRVIVRPLAGLAGAVKKVERGERPKFDRTTNDEIGQLSTAFAAMSTAIEQRETRIAERNRDMRRVLDNVEDGFVTVDAAGVMSEERSRVLETWFGAVSAGATFFDYMDRIAGERVGAWLRLSWDSLSDGFLPLAVATEQFPKRFERAGHFYAIDYRPIVDGEVLKAVLVVIRDVTERVERERAEQMQRETMVIFKHVLSDRVGFDQFVVDAGRLVDAIEHGDAIDDVTLRRHIHTLKGNASIFALDSVARYCHELESRMVDDETRPAAAQVAGLRSVWNDVASTYEKFNAGGAARIVIDEDEQSELLRVIRSGAGAREIAAIVTSWRYERADVRMTSIAEQVRQVARRMAKGEIDVRIAPSKLRLPPQRWAAFWSVFGHVVRNAIDHGIEGPDRRAALGKPPAGVVQMSFEERGSEVFFRFGDDGAGIDWDRLKVKAAEKGLPTGTRGDLEKALYVDSVSTRDEASSTSGRGVGMGAVLAVVEARGGRIALETRPGAGTTWVYRYPVA